MHTSTTSNTWLGSDVLKCEHYDYAIKREEWKAIDIALQGGIKWTAAALRQFDCEPNANFTLRKDSAFNRIKIETPIRSLQGLARGSKDQARIEGAADRIAEVLNGDFDNNGNSWFTWVVDKALKNVPAFGKYFIFTSTPSQVSKITLADEKDNQPFVFGREPLQVLNWKYENGSTRDNGQFSDILFLTTEMVTNEKTLFDDQIDIAVRITRDTYFILAVNNCSAYDINGFVQDFEQGAIIREFPNELGIVPCRCVDIGDSILTDAVNLSLQALNIQSGSFVGTLDSNYNQKWVSGGELPEKFISGVDSVLQFQAADAKYNITENPSGTIENSISFIDDLQGALDVMMQNEYANLAKKGGNAPSGEALTQMNASQAQAVGYLMDGIGDALVDIIAWEHLLAGLPIPEDLKVIMPATYESTTKADAVELTLSMQDVVALSEEGLKIKITEKWAPITPPEDLKDVVAAELEKELALLNATSALDSAGSTDLDGSGSDSTGGDAENQAEAEGDTDVSNG